MRTNIIFAVALILTSSITYLVTKRFCAETEPIVFTSEVPKFDPEEKAVLERLSKKIVGVVPEFYEYYIKNIQIQSEGIIVVLYPLAVLQNADVKEKGLIRTSGSALKLKFDSDFNFIEKYRN